MAIARNTHYTGGLVDLDTGRVSREIFVSDAIYEEEQERVFTRAWLFVDASMVGKEEMVFTQDIVEIREPA